MHAEETIIAPRIVQPRPWRSAILLLVVLVGAAAAAYTGFHYGRQLAPDTGKVRTDELTHLRGRIVELEAENTDLLAHMQALSSPRSEEPLAGVGSPQADAEPEATVSELPTATQQEPQEQRQPPADTNANTPPSPQKEVIAAAPPAAQVADTGGNPEALGESDALKIQDFRLRPSDASNSVRFSFAVGLADGGSGSVAGSIWIAVNGLSDAKPVRLRLREASKDKSDFVRMRFKQRQLVEGVFVLPEGFTPKNVIVEAKPLEEESYKAAASTFDWIVSDG